MPKGLGDYKKGHHYKSIMMLFFMHRNAAKG